MRRLEVIHLRMSGGGSVSLLDAIFKSVATEVAARARLYRHAAIEGDLAVHLFSQADDPSAGKSDVGLRLASALRDVGMVEHTLWIEEHRIIDEPAAGALTPEERER